jgi:hypothetical protein
VSKGSGRRPTAVPTEQVEANHAATFGPYVPPYLRRARDYPEVWVARANIDFTGMSAGVLGLAEESSSPGDRE